LVYMWYKNNGIKDHIPIMKVSNEGIASILGQGKYESSIGYLVLYMAN